MSYRSRTSNSSPAHIGSLALTVAVAVAILLSMAISCGGDADIVLYEVSGVALLPGGMLAATNGGTTVESIRAYRFLVDPN